MYGNPYYSANTQVSVDRIENQIKELENMRSQLQRNSSPTAINQTFQLAPSTGGVRYASTIEDVKREIVYVDTPFFSKDMSVMWLKSSKGQITPYELKEIVEKDEKDLQIEYLQEQIEELKGMIKNEYNANTNRENVQTSSSTSDETAREQTEDDKSSGVQRTRGSKKE